MKILHTADLHLGIKLEDRSRITEQALFFDELNTIADTHQIDVILIAGDIYHTFSPTSESERLFYKNLKKLSRNGARLIFIISGNHDSPTRLSSIEPLTLEQGILFAKHPKDTFPIETFEHYAITDAGEGFVEISLRRESLVILFMPYPSEVTLNEIISDKITDVEIQSEYTKKIGALFNQNINKYRTDTINIAVGHFHITGGSASKDNKSERDIMIGGAYAVNAEDLPQTAQYIAMGHLHRPQKIKENIYYSGSPIEYSLSEARQQKYVNILDITPDSLDITQIPLTNHKPIDHIKATSIEDAFARLEAKKDEDSWVYLDIATDRVLTPTEIKEIRKLKKDIVIIKPLLQATETENLTETPDELSISEEFLEFYKSKREGVSPSQETIELFLKLTQFTDKEV